MDGVLHGGYDMLETGGGGGGAGLGPGEERVVIIPRRKSEEEVSDVMRVISDLFDELIS